MAKPGPPFKDRFYVTNSIAAKPKLHIAAHWGPPKTGPKLSSICGIRGSVWSPDDIQLKNGRICEVCQAGLEEAESA